VSWRQHLQLNWLGSGASTKTATLHTAANPAADPGAASGIITASQALSAAVVEAVQVVPSLIVGGSAGSSPYPSCLDYVKFQFRSEAGELVDYHVPAPIAAILTGPGFSRIDPTNALVIALIDAVIANGASSSGSPIVEFVQGGRYRIPTPRVF
jgi:hypothetical protein